MGRFPVLPAQVCRYNPVGMLRFRTSILPRLSAVSELFGDLLRFVNAGVRSQSSLVAENLLLWGSGWPLRAVMAALPKVS